MSLLRCTSTLGCPELSLEAALALAAKHGLQAIEVRAAGGTTDLPAYFAATYGSPAVLADRLRGRTVRIAAFNASLHLVGATPAEKDDLVALAPWAEALGVRWLRVFDGGKSADGVEVATARETLRWWADLRSRRGWKAELMVETHDSLFTAERIERFIVAEPHVAVLWDAH